MKRKPPRIEEVSEPADLGWLVSWSSATHTSFLIRTGHERILLGGLLGIATPDLGAISRILTLLWKAAEDPPVARVLIVTYEPVHETLTGLKLTHHQSLAGDGPEAHLFNVHDTETLAGLLDTHWHLSDDFVIFFGHTGQDVTLDAADARDLRFSIPEQCLGAAGKYQGHPEALAVVVRKEPGQDWSGRLEYASVSR